MHRLDELRQEILVLLDANPTDDELADKVFTAVQEAPEIPVPWSDKHRPADLGVEYRMRLRVWSHEPASEAEKERLDRRRSLRR